MSAEYGTLQRIVTADNQWTLLLLLGLASAAEDLGGRARNLLQKSGSGLWEDGRMQMGIGTELQSGIFSCKLLENCSILFCIDIIATMPSVTLFRWLQKSKGP